MDATTILLFSRFPREVGDPWRILVRNVREMERFVATRNGVRDVYVSIYAFDLVIDKVWVEFDSEDLNKALLEAKELASRLRKSKLPFIPVFSGRKGFHFYILLKPWRSPSVETAKALLLDFQENLTDGLETVDRHGFGDVRRMVRVPNTLNGSRYCTYLPLEFVRWEMGDILKYAERRHNHEYALRIEKSILDLSSLRPNPTDVGCGLRNKTKLPANGNGTYEFLVNIVRPCIAESAVSSNPPHIVRVDLVSELIWLGYGPEEVCSFISGLKWEDYDPNITRYHVQQIASHRYLPVSCRKLRWYVNCTQCGWRYFWRDVNVWSSVEG